MKINRRQGKNLYTNHHEPANRNLTASLVLLVWFVISLLLLTSCPEDIQLGEETLTGEQGSLSLSLYIDEISSSRTILPQNTNWSAFTGLFEIDITGQPLITRNINNLSNPIQLDAGNYDITVTALDGADPIARGQINITVIAGEPSAHIIRLKSIFEAGVTGTFGWNVTIPAAASGQMRITQIDGTFVGTENLTQGVNNGTRDLNSNYYFVTTTLAKTGSVDVIRRDVMHIYQNMTSVFEIEFSDALFNSSLHYVTFDYSHDGLSEMEPVIHGELIAKPSPDPQRNGYHFNGWFTDTDAVNEFHFNEPILDSITLYASWLPNIASITLTVAQIENGDPIFTALSAPIVVSRNGIGTPAVFNVSVANAGIYSHFKWEIAGVGLMPSHIIEGASASAFTINGANPNYATLGGHVLKLTVTRNGILYQVNIPFTIIETIPPVEVNVNGVTTGYADLAAAFTAIGANAGNFIITLRENQTMTTNRTISTANQHITIIGEGAQRTINVGTTTTMFTISNANASLTLGNNVTIQGRATAGIGDVIQISAGTFKMLEGSRITGHQVSSATSAVVYISGTASRFEMSGGSIDGNNNIALATSTNASGGVHFLTGTIVMTGGSITDNTHGTKTADVYHAVTNANSFTMSGNATIGALKLNAAGTTAAASVNIGAGWSGEIETLNLRGADAGVGIAAGWWNNKLIFNGITTTQIARIGIGDFISSNNVTTPVNDEFILVNTGTDIGRLILKLTLSVIQIFDEDDLRRVGRGTVHNGRMWSLYAQYRLMNSITLTGDWTRIGGDTAATGFTGTFDGNGKTITGMTTAANSGTNQGMFGFLSAGSVVRNLGLANVNIRGTNNVGSFAGRNEGRIENSFVTGSITGNAANVGGIAGGNTGTIENCYVIANITGLDDLGGITGIGGGTIRNCYVAGTITGGVVRSNYGVGGIQGDGGTIQHCITLLQSITVTSNAGGLGRINGLNVTRTNNRAWSDTTFTPAKTVTSSLTSTDGLDVTTAELKTLATWENAATTGAAFSFGASDTSPWVWQDGKMPRLYWETGSRDWPSYLEPIIPGSGTALDPFNIYSEIDLRAVGRGTYNGASWSTSAHYRLMNNIDLTGKPNWTPIGDAATGFTGTFNGNGKTITGMTNAPNSTTDQGMFSYLNTGSVVRNLGLENVNIRGTRYVGGFTGENSGTIENCFVTGSITGTGTDVGGIAGTISVGGTIQNCYVIANITGKDDLGGITGYVASSGVLRNCYAAGTITSVGADNYYGVGGISGYSTISFQNCIALLQSITLTSGNDYNRINGYGSAPLVNNRAWSGMVLTPTKDVTNSLTSNDGLSVTAAALKTQTTWQASGAAFSFGTSDASPWVWENGKMPRFHWETGSRDWPSYLTD